jgi:hypothetical protein
LKKERRRTKSSECYYYSLNINRFIQEESAAAAATQNSTERKKERKKEEKQTKSLHNNDNTSTSIAFFFFFFSACISTFCLHISPHFATLQFLLLSAPAVVCLFVCLFVVFNNEGISAPNFFLRAAAAISGDFENLILWTILAQF